MEAYYAGFNQNPKFPWGYLLGVLAMLAFVMIVFIGFVQAEPINLKASWYSIDSLKKEGTYAYSKGIMANNKLFRDDCLTAAARCFPLGCVVNVTNCANGKSVRVVITDRIGKRFAKTRIDLSKGAFLRIADLKQGLVNVKVEKL